MNQKQTREGGSRSWAEQLQQIIKRRRMSVFMIIGAFLILLILYNVGNFIFLNQMANQMETELGNRLNSIAKLSASIVENEFPESFSPTMKNRLSLSVIKGELQNIRKQHQLEGLFIIDRNFNTVLDSYQNFELDITRTYLKNDAPWIERTWQGIPSTGPLHTFQG
ncbi:MAG TPA: hypothetical protein ENH29_04290, partial [Bacteroidetes bacterium]|nr:hypothetical protein [Bacteroidota bacterium]